MSKYPLIKFVILFICGYLIQFYLNIRNELLFYLSILLLSFLLILSFIKTKLNFLKTIVLAITIVTISGLYYSTFSKHKVKYPFILPKYNDVKVLGKISDIELIGKNKITFYLSTDSIIIHNNLFKVRINLLCNIFGEKESLKKIYDSLEVGNKIMTFGNIHRARNKRNIGEFDYENYLNQKQIHALLDIKYPESIKVISGESNFFQNIIFSARKKIDEIITKYHNENTSALLRGLLLADRSKIEYETKTDFINTGVIHVLAVSGLHVGFVSLIFILLFQRFNIYLKYALTIIGLLLFMVITNSPPSVVRAVIMAIVMILSSIMGRKYLSINALALSAFIILVINPNELFNPGFQLSFIAVASILIFYPIFREKIFELNVNSKLFKNIFLYGAVSLAAQIGTLPLILIYFYKLSIISLIANLVVIPLIGFIVGLGVFTLLIYIVSATVCVYYANVNEFLTCILLFITNKMGNISFAYIPVNQFTITDAIMFYSSLFLLFFLLKKITSFITKILVILLLLLNFYFWTKLDNIDFLPDNKLTILAIDVGQGDSFLIKFPNNKIALIDAGNANQYFDNGERIILPLLEKLNIKRIDYGFISHIDKDHCGGFYSLIRRKKVKLIYKPPVDSSDKLDVNFEKFLRENKVFFKYYSKNIIDMNNTRIYILNDTNYNKNKFIGSNDRSGIIKIVFGNTSFLFTGDITSKTENYLINEYKNFLKSDLLKVSHHGSKTGTSDYFLHYVQPKYALISVGIVNQFRHPHKEVIQRLSKRKVKIFRTDLNGAIMIQSNGYLIKNIDWKKLENKYIF